MTVAWKYLIDQLEPITFWASVAASVLGLVALLLVCFLWSWLGRYYREFWAKVVVAGFRAVAAIAAIAARAAPTKPNQLLVEQPWAATILIAATGYLLWEIAGAVGDHKYKLSKERTAAAHQAAIDELNRVHQVALEVADHEVELANQDRTDAEFQAMRLRWLLSHLRPLVRQKVQRIRRVTHASAGARASIQQAREGLAPTDQINFLLECLASLFRMQAVHEDGNRHNQNFRIGLFAEQEGRLVPLAAFDLVTRSHEPFSSYTRHADRYRLDNDTNPSHAVRCVREGRTLIVADCASEPDFYFHDRQPSYLRSMIAFNVRLLLRRDQLSPRRSPHRHRRHRLFPRRGPGNARITAHRVCGENRSRVYYYRVDRVRIGIAEGRE